MIPIDTLSREPSRSARSAARSTGWPIRLALLAVLLSLATAVGAVSSAHPLATEAGLDILRQGGNAFDAAVAVASVLTVVEPMSSNLLGGYGTLIVHEGSTGETRYLDNNGRFPAATDSDLFRAAESRSEIMRSAQAVSTPGTGKPS